MTRVSGAEWTLCRFPPQYLVMAEASDGKAALPPSDDGDAERDQHDPVDASATEALSGAEA